MTTTTVPSIRSLQPRRRRTIERPTGRFADLEGYRGIAALAVVLYHVHQHVLQSGGPMPGWWANRLLQGLDGFVDLFFVLSAFLLTLPFAQASLAGQAQPDGTTFVVRRVARIVPLYFVAVAVVWAFRNPVLPGDVTDLVEHLLFVQVYDPVRTFFTIGPAWSLAVEVQFYALLVAVGSAWCTVAPRIPERLRLRLLLGTIGALASVSLLWRVIAWYGFGIPTSYSPAWFGLQSRLDTFALGMLLAVAVARRVSISRRMAFVLRVTGLLVVVGAMLARPWLAGPHVWFDLVVAVGFVLLLAASVLGPPGVVTKLLTVRPLILLGVISYSLYLWHEPILLWLDAWGLMPSGADQLPRLLSFGLLTLVAVPLAWLSYLVIERPAGNLRLLVDRRGRNRDYYDGS